MARTGNNDVAGRLSIFRSGMALRIVHQRAYIAHWRISTWLRGRKATAPSRSTVKPPLTELKIWPVTFSPFFEGPLRAKPSFLQRRLFTDRTASPSAFQYARGKLQLRSPMDRRGFCHDDQFRERKYGFNFQAAHHDGQNLFSKQLTVPFDHAAFLLRSDPKVSSRRAAKIFAAFVFRYS